MTTDSHANPSASQVDIQAKLLVPSVVSGGPIWVETIVKNIGAQPIELPAAGTGQSPLVFVVFDMAGKQVAAGDWKSAMIQKMYPKGSGPVPPTDIPLPEPPSSPTKVGKGSDIAYRDDIASLLNKPSLEPGRYKLAVRLIQPSSGLDKTTDLSLEVLTPGDFALPFTTGESADTPALSGSDRQMVIRAPGSGSGFLTGHYRTSAHASSTESFAVDIYFQGLVVRSLPLGETDPSPVKPNPHQGKVDPGSAGRMNVESAFKLDFSKATRGLPAGRYQAKVRLGQLTSNSQDFEIKER